MIGSSNAPGVLIGREDGMPQKVWKYNLSLDSGPRCVLEMPGGAKVVSVGAQGQRLCMWAVATPAERMQERYFYVVGTGHQVPPDAHTYLGRITLGDYEFHVFEGFK